MNVTPDIKTLLKASYLPQKDADKQLQQYGWTYDPELSRMDTKVFTDKEGKPVVLHRGSTRAGDWLQTNTSLALGLEQYSPRFKHAKDITEKAKKKYKQPVTAIGHSLGGALSEKTGADKIITYNKPVTLFDVGKIIPSNQLDIRTNFDPISALSSVQLPKNKKKVKSSIFPLKAHSISSLPSNKFFY